MTLRRRLLIALFVLALAFGMFGAGIVTAHRSFLLQRLDAELAGYAAAPHLVLSTSADERRPVAVADVYAGRLAASSELWTSFAPTADPALKPDLVRGDVLTAPVFRGTTAGRAHTVRVITAPLSNGVQAVFALPTAAMDEAVLQLVGTLTAGGLAVLLAIAAVLWWTYRTGLRPYRQLAAAARALNRGERRPVPPGPPGTDAAELARAYNTLLEACTAAEQRSVRFNQEAVGRLQAPLAHLRATVAPYAGPARASDAYGLVNLQGVTAALRQVDVDGAELDRVLRELSGEPEQP